MLKKLKQSYLHGFHKTDKTGNPVFYSLLSSINEKGLFEAVSYEELLEHDVYRYEQIVNVFLPACSKKANRYVSYIISILDLKGAVSRLMSSKIMSHLKETMACAQDNYPEIMGSIYLTNTGFMFKMLWNLVKVFLDKKTKDKIIVLGSDYKAKLLEIIDKDDLPKELGGECECKPEGCVFHNPGPWETKEYN